LKIELGELTCFIILGNTLKTMKWIRFLLDPSVLGLEEKIVAHFMVSFIMVIGIPEPGY